MIDSFFGNNRFLSNFYNAPVKYEGYKFPSVENAYQFAKIDIKIVSKEHIKMFQQCTAAKSKQLGRNIPLRQDWDQIRLEIMEYLVRQKFQIPDLRNRLVNTYDQILVEGNTWGDTFWGVCNGNGSNHLGKILMKIRRDLMVYNIDDLF